MMSKYKKSVISYNYTLSLPFLWVLAIELTGEYVHSECVMVCTHIAKHEIGIFSDFCCRKIDVNQQDGEGNTALHLACEHNNEAISRLLLDHGAGDDLILNSYSSNPVQKILN